MAAEFQMGFGLTDGGTDNPAERPSPEPTPEPAAPTPEPAEPTPEHEPAEARPTQAERDAAAGELLNQAAVAWKAGRPDVTHRLLLNDWAEIWRGELGADGIRIPDDLLNRFYKGWALLAADEARADWEKDGRPTRIKDGK